MFGTIIVDAYRKDEVAEIVDALDDLCSPNDEYGWASAGIYCFWDYDSNEVLYIGLASDLSVRFKQHNGILRIQDNACKYQQIQEYFLTHDKLGYSIFVQSPFAQPLVYRNKPKFQDFSDTYDIPLSDILSEHGANDMKRVEGILIEAYRQEYGHFPAWNKMGGDLIGQRKVQPLNINIVKSFCNPKEYLINPLLSRSTLRELATHSEYEMFECNYFHTARSHVLLFGIDYEEALKGVDYIDTFGYRQALIETGYDKKELVV